MLNLNDDYEGPDNNSELPRWDQVPDLQIVENTPGTSDSDVPPPIISDMDALINEISRLPKQPDPDYGAN